MSEFAYYLNIQQELQLLISNYSVQSIRIVGHPEDATSIVLVSYKPKWPLLDKSMVLTIS